MKYKACHKFEFDPTMKFRKVEASSLNNKGLLNLNEQQLSHAI